uniref:Secreted protein n=1 Tax=Anopheles darlingi TaxID=43151 RepID=A0A2M4DL85_ANODA
MVIMRRVWLLLVLSLLLLLLVEQPHPLQSPPQVLLPPLCGLVIGCVFISRLGWVACYGSLLDWVPCVLAFLLVLVWG